MPATNIFRAAPHPTTQTAATAGGTPANRSQATIPADPDRLFIPQPLDDVFFSQLVGSASEPTERIITIAQICGVAFHFVDKLISEYFY